MSYATLETSTHDGAPVELYDISGGGVDHHWTSADAPITVGSLTYQPIFVERGNIEAGNEANRFTLDMRVAADNSLALAFVPAPPLAVVTVEIHRRHRADSEQITIFSGRLVAVTWARSLATLTLEPVYSPIRRDGLRRRYGRGCTYVLYGQECGVSRAAHAVSDTVITRSGNVLTTGLAGAKADGYYAGGYLKVDGQLGQAMIIDHAGDDLTLAQTLPQLVAGAAITYYPGCAHTLAVCDTKFGNSPNYGGMPFFPSVNPFRASVF